MTPVLQNKIPSWYNCVDIEDQSVPVLTSMVVMFIIWVFNADIVIYPQSPVCVVAIFVKSFQSIT